MSMGGKGLPSFSICAPAGRVVGVVDLLIGEIPSFTDSDIHRCT